MQVHCTPVTSGTHVLGQLIFSNSEGIKLDFIGWARAKQEIRLKLQSIYTLTTMEMLPLPEMYARDIYGSQYGTLMLLLCANNIDLFDL